MFVYLVINVRVRGSTAANFWVGSLGFLVPSTLTKLSPDLASNNTCSLSLSPCQCTTTEAQTVSYYVVVEGGSAQFTKWQKHSKYSYAYHYCEFETTIKQKLPSKATPREQNIGNKTQKKKKTNKQPPTLLFGHHHLHHHITRANMFAHIIHLNKKQPN